MTLSPSHQKLKDKWQKEVSINLTNLSFRSWLMKKYNDANNLIIINVNSIGKKLKERIPNINSDEWMNTIIDILEEEYQIESKLHKICSSN